MFIDTKNFFFCCNESPQSSSATPRWSKHNLLIEIIVLFQKISPLFLLSIWNSQPYSLWTSSKSLSIKCLVSPPLLLLLWCRPRFYNLQSSLLMFWGRFLLLLQESKACLIIGFVKETPLRVSCHVNIVNPLAERVESLLACNHSRYDLSRV